MHNISNAAAWLFLLCLAGSPARAFNPYEHKLIGDAGSKGIELRIASPSGRVLVLPYDREQSPAVRLVTRSQVLAFKADDELASRRARVTGLDVKTPRNRRIFSLRQEVAPEVSATADRVAVEGVRSERLSVLGVACSTGNLQGTEHQAGSVCVEFQRQNGRFSPSSVLAEQGKGKCGSGKVQTGSGETALARVCGLPGAAGGAPRQHRYD